MISYIEATSSTVEASKAIAGALNVALRDLPPVFPRKVGDPVLPLAIGSGKALKDIKPADASGMRLRRAMIFYTNQTAYIQALAANGAKRFDLEAVEVDAVSDQNRRQAKARLARRSRSADSRRNAKVEVEVAKKNRAAFSVAEKINNRRSEAGQQLKVPSVSDLRLSLGLSTA